MICHFSNYYREFPKPVEAYDTAHDGTLMRTLRVYCEKSRDIKACADELFVHHNTVRYRLDQNILKIVYRTWNNFRAKHAAVIYNKENTLLYFYIEEQYYYRVQYSR
jgi:sugar diacid utilization regulator